MRMMACQACPVHVTSDLLKKPNKTEAPPTPRLDRKWRHAKRRAAARNLLHAFSHGKRFGLKSKALCHHAYPPTGKNDEQRVHPPLDQNPDGIVFVGEDLSAREKEERKKEKNKWRSLVGPLVDWFAKRKRRESAEVGVQCDIIVCEGGISPRWKDRLPPCPQRGQLCQTLTSQTPSLQTPPRPTDQMRFERREGSVSSRCSFTSGVSSYHKTPLTTGEEEEEEEKGKRRTGVDERWREDERETAGTRFVRMGGGGALRGWGGSVGRVDTRGERSEVSRGEEKMGHGEKAKEGGKSEGDGGRRRGGGVGGRGSRVIEDFVRNRGRSSDLQKAFANRNQKPATPSRNRIFEKFSAPSSATPASSPSPLSKRSSTPFPSTSSSATTYSAKHSSKDDAVPQQLEEEANGTDDIAHSSEKFASPSELESRRRLSLTPSVSKLFHDEFRRSSGEKWKEKEEPSTSLSVEGDAGAVMKNVNATSTDESKRSVVEKVGKDPAAMKAMDVSKTQREENEAASKKEDELRRNNNKNNFYECGSVSVLSRGLGLVEEAGADQTERLFKFDSDPRQISDIWDKWVRLRSIRRRCVDSSLTKIKCDHASEMSMQRFSHDYADDPRGGGGRGVTVGRGGASGSGGGVGGNERANPLPMKRAEIRSEAEDSRRDRADDDDKEEELRYHLTDALELKRIIKEEIDVVLANHGKEEEEREGGARGRGGEGGGRLRQGEEIAAATDDLALGEEASNLSPTTAAAGFVKTPSLRDFRSQTIPQIPERRFHPTNIDAVDIASAQPSNETLPPTQLLAAEEVRKICHFAGVLNNILERVNAVPETGYDHALTPTSSTHRQLQWQMHRQQASPSQHKEDGYCRYSQHLPQPRETLQETIKMVIDEYQRREEEADVLSEVFSFLDSVDMTEEEIVNFPTFDLRRSRGRRSDYCAVETLTNLCGSGGSSEIGSRSGSETTIVGVDPNCLHANIKEPIETSSRGEAVEGPKGCFQEDFETPSGSEVVKESAECVEDLMETATKTDQTASRSLKEEVGQALGPFFIFANDNDGGDEDYNDNNNNKNSTTNHVNNNRNDNNDDDDRFAALCSNRRHGYRKKEVDSNEFQGMAFFARAGREEKSTHFYTQGAKPLVQFGLYDRHAALNLQSGTMRKYCDEVKATECRRKPFDAFRDMMTSASRKRFGSFSKKRRLVSMVTNAGKALRKDRLGKLMRQLRERNSHREYRRGLTFNQTLNNDADVRVSSPPAADALHRSRFTDAAPNSAGARFLRRRDEPSPVHGAAFNEAFLRAISERARFPNHCSSNLGIAESPQDCDGKKTENGQKVNYGKMRDYGQKMDHNDRVNKVTAATDDEWGSRRLAPRRLREPKSAGIVRNAAARRSHVDVSDVQQPSTATTANTQRPTTAITASTPDACLPITSTSSHFTESATSLAAPSPANIFAPTMFDIFTSIATESTSIDATRISSANSQSLTAGKKWRRVMTKAAAKTPTFFMEPSLKLEDVSLLSPTLTKRQMEQINTKQQQLQSQRRQQLQRRQQSQQQRPRQEHMKRNANLNVEAETTWRNASRNAEAEEEEEKRRQVAVAMETKDELAELTRQVRQVKEDLRIWNVRDDAICGELRPQQQQPQKNQSGRQCCGCSCSCVVIPPVVHHQEGCFCARFDSPRCRNQEKSSFTPPELLVNNFEEEREMEMVKVTGGEAGEGNTKKVSDNMVQLAETEPWKVEQGTDIKEEGTEVAIEEMTEEARKELSEEAQRRMEEEPTKEVTEEVQWKMTEEAMKEVKEEVQRRMTEEIMEEATKEWTEELEQRVTEGVNEGIEKKLSGDDPMHSGADAPAVSLDRESVVVQKEISGAVVSKSKSSPTLIRCRSVTSQRTQTCLTSRRRRQQQPQQQHYDRSLCTPTAPRKPQCFCAPPLDVEMVMSMKSDRKSEIASRPPMWTSPPPLLPRPPVSTPTTLKSQQLPQQPYIRMQSSPCNQCGLYPSQGQQQQQQQLQLPHRSVSESNINFNEALRTVSREVLSISMKCLRWICEVVSVSGNLLPDHFLGSIADARVYEVGSADRHLGCHVRGKVDETSAVFGPDSLEAEEKDGQSANEDNLNNNDKYPMKIAQRDEREHFPAVGSGRVDYEELDGYNWEKGEEYRAHDLSRMELNHQLFSAESMDASLKGCRSSLSVGSDGGGCESGSGAGYGGGRCRGVRGSGYGGGSGGKRGGGFIDHEKRERVASRLSLDRHSSLSLRERERVASGFSLNNCSSSFLDARERGGGGVSQFSFNDRSSPFFKEEDASRFSLNHESDSGRGSESGRNHWPGESRHHGYENPQRTMRHLDDARRESKQRWQNQRGESGFRFCDEYGPALKESLTDHGEVIRGVGGSVSKHRIVGGMVSGRDGRCLTGKCSRERENNYDVSRFDSDVDPLCYRANDATRRRRVDDRRAGVGPFTVGGIKGILKKPSRSF